MSKRRSAPILIELIRDRTELRHGQPGSGSGTASPTRPQESETPDLPFEPAARIDEEEEDAPSASTSVETRPRRPEPAPAVKRETGTRHTTETAAKSATPSYSTAGGFVPATSARRPQVTSATRPSAAPRPAAAAGTAGGSTGAMPAAGTLPSRLSRIWRVPVGFVLVYVGVTIIVIALAYSTGYNIGKKHEAASFGAGLSQTPSEPLDNTTNRMAANSAPAQGSPASNAQNNQSQSSPPPTTRNTQQGTPSQPAPGQSGAQSRNAVSVSEDTREKGLNYIIVEQFPADEAGQVAVYLIRNGIDVMILPANDRSLRQVVVRQGFKGWRSNQQGQQTLDAVRRLGWAWRSRYGGSKDFEQAFVDLYD